MKKCIHCERPVDFISGKGWVHMPEGRAYVMEHEIKSEKEIARYKRDYNQIRSKGCGWIGVQPVDTITWDTDICPKCGAQGELADNHVASPSHDKADMRAGICTFPDRCQKAECTHCDCACGGTNHRLQGSLFN